MVKWSILIINLTISYAVLKFSIWNTVLMVKTILYGPYFMISQLNETIRPPILPRYNIFIQINCWPLTEDVCDSWYSQINIWNWFGCWFRNTWETAKSFLDMILVSEIKPCGRHKLKTKYSLAMSHCQMITFYSRSNSYLLRIINGTSSITRMTSWSLPFCGYVNGKWFRQDQKNSMWVRFKHFDRQPSWNSKRQTSNLANYWEVSNNIWMQDPVLSV